MLSIYEQVNEAFAYLHGLWRYRWAALLIAWLVAVAGWLAVYSMPNEYKAKAAVHMDTTSIMQPLLAGLSVQTNFEEELSLMTRYLLSRKNLLSVIRETDMDHAADSPAEEERLVASLARSIGLKYVPAGKGRSAANIYEISYQSDSAEGAYKVVSTLLSTLIENTLSSGRTDTILAQEFLDEQIAEYEKRLAADEARMAEFQKRNVGFMPDEKGGYYARLRGAQADIDSTKSDLRLARQRYAELHKQLSGESPVLGVGDYARSSVAKLSTYRDELADMLAQFTEEHPDVKALRSRIADLQAAGSDSSNELETLYGDSEGEFNPVYQELKVRESQAKIEISSLQIQLAEKQKKLDELQLSVDIIPQVEADLAKLNRDYGLTKQRHLTLVERREQARLAQKVEQNNSEIAFQIVDAPVVPTFPSGPNRPLLLAGVMLAALGAAVSWALIRFMFYPTFVDYKQLQKLLDLPVLGTVGLHIGPEQKRSRRLHLATFLLALIMMFGVFGGVLLFQQQGSSHIRTLMAAVGL